MTSANLWFQSTSIRCQGPSKTLIFPHVLMISANLANQWNPKHFHKMSEISQNTMFVHVFLVFSHSKFGASSFGNGSLILSFSPALYMLFDYIVLCCIIVYHIMLNYILYYIIYILLFTWYYISWYYIVLHYNYTIVLYYTVFCCNISYYTISDFILWYNVILYCGTFWGGHWSYYIARWDYQSKF